LYSVHFIHSGNAYLPELQAYREYLEDVGISVFVHKGIEDVPDTPNVIWWICGMPQTIPARIWDRAFVIHEYASASVGKLTLIKDIVKRFFTPKPDYRLFLNTWVKERLGFSDDIPSDYRDMGVPTEFLSKNTVTNSTECRFDLIYVGETSRLEEFVRTIESINQAGLTLLIVGYVEEALSQQLSSLPNISFTGRIEQSQVLNYLRQSRCGLNLMPLKKPFIYQTSTKVLEYLSVGLPVLSNKYHWIAEYKLEGKANIQFLPQSSSYKELLSVFLASQKVHKPLSQSVLSWQDILQKSELLKIILRENEAVNK
jgi:glycosyltransferase involved in cell wall biosynthesis